jgi:hypothetical protein
MKPPRETGTMKITVSQIAPSRKGLRLGLRIEHEKAGWVRFATTVLLLDSLTYAERQMLLSWLEDSPRQDDWDEDIPLFDAPDAQHRAPVVTRSYHHWPTES